ncbi:MAG: hypothetical protein FDW93_02155 [Bergeyella sp.]|nr:hypothetical protein [Bergeyella sp.]
MPSLQELKTKKNLLNAEIKELEDIMTFNSPKKSLGILTGGLTDKFLKEFQTPSGRNRLGLDFSSVKREISEGLRSMVSKNPMVELSKSEGGGELIKNAIKLCIVTVLANYANKNMQKKNWQNKVLGSLIIFAVPIAFKYLRKAIESYQKNKTTSGFKQLM